MKHSSVLLPAAGFIIAVGCALAPRHLPAPFFGYHPETGRCEQGIIEGSCTGGTLQCSVTVDGYTNLPAYDTKSSTTLCTIPVYKAAGSTPPPPGEDNPDPSSLTSN